jgi:hypothetical protein
LPFANIRERERIEQKREYCQVLKINVEQAKPSQGSLPSRGGGGGWEVSQCLKKGEKRMTVDHNSNQNIQKTKGVLRQPNDERHEGRDLTSVHTISPIPIAACLAISPRWQGRRATSNRRPAFGSPAVQGKFSIASAWPVTAPLLLTCSEQRVDSPLHTH